MNDAGARSWHAARTPGPTEARSGKEAREHHPGSVFVPVADIFETDQALTVILEMPGVSKDSVDVSVETDVLTIEGRVDFSNYDGLQPLYTEYNVGN